MQISLNQVFLPIIVIQSSLQANLKNLVIWEKPENLQNSEVNLTVGGKVEKHLYA